MKYIKLIKELKTDFSDSFYIQENFLGIAYANDDKIIGTFKGSYTDIYLTPFKFTPDKGTYGRYDSEYMCSAGNKYAILDLDSDGNRQVYIYPYEWDNDKIEYDFLWTLSRGDVYSRYRDVYGVFIDDLNYYLASYFDIITTYPMAKNTLTRWNANQELMRIEIDDCENFNPFVRPGIRNTYTKYTGEVDFFITIIPRSYDYNQKKIRIQVASDSNFTNIISEEIKDITYDSMWQQQSISKTIIIKSTDQYSIQYVRARGENSDGSQYSSWTPSIILNYNSPSNQNYTYYSFPTDYTGTEIQRKVFGIVKRGNNLDILEQVLTNTVTNGSKTQRLDFYIKTFDLSGNLISTTFVYTRPNNIYPIGTPRMIVRNGKTYILDLYSDYTTLKVFQFDGTNITSKTINPQHDGFDDALFQTTGDLVVFTDSNSDWTQFYAYSWDWDTEKVTSLDLPMGIYNNLSNTFDGNGFWFEFDDGTYVGIAFAYKEQKTMAFSFNQFIQNFIRR